MRPLWRRARGNLCSTRSGCSRRQPLCSRTSAPGNPAEPAAAALIQSPTPIRVAHLQGRGRGLVATRAISRGEIFLREQPLASVAVGRNAPWSHLGAGAAALDGEWERNGQRFPRLCLRLVGLLLSRPGLWHDQLRHLCYPKMQSRFPEEWVTDFRRLRHSLLNGHDTGTEGNRHASGLPRDVAEQFDAMFTPEVWGTLMGMAHLNSFRLRCPTVTDPDAEATCLFVPAPLNKSLSLAVLLTVIW